MLTVIINEIILQQLAFSVYQTTQNRRLYKNQERERERQRQRHRDRDRQRDSETETERDRDRKIMLLVQ